MGTFLWQKFFIELSGYELVDPAVVFIFVIFTEVTDPQLKKEVQELSKIESGIATVFLKNVKDREKLNQWKRANLDPRNASR